MIPDIRWLNCNQQTNKLFTIDPESFSLYKVNQRCGKTDPYELSLICSCSLTSVVPTKQEHDILRCFALDHSLNNYLALGFSNGRVNITKADVDSGTKFSRGEDIRDTQKGISCLAWHYNETNKLCSAYEKGRGLEHTVVVYDINRSPKGLTREQPISVFETNLSEKIFGVSWFKDDSNILVVSSSRKIGIADIRERSGFQITVNFPTPQLGLCTEPTIGYRFACHSRNTISIFDRRFINFPIHEISVGSDSQIISRLDWQHNRPAHMTCGVKECGNLYNLSISPNAYGAHSTGLNNGLKHSTTMDNLKNTIQNMSDEYKYSVQALSVPGSNKLISFDWHPTYKTKLAVLVASNSSKQQIASRNIRIIHQAYEVSATISCFGDIAFTSGNSLEIAKKTSISNSDSNRTQTKFVELTSYFQLPDLASQIRQRIDNGYGYGNTSNPLLSKLETIIESSRNAIEKDKFANQDIKFCWNWVHRMFESNPSGGFPGINHIIKDMKAKSISTIRNDEVTYRNRIFTNEHRDKILKICGWPDFEDKLACKIMFDTLMNRGNVHAQARAAALAMFAVQGSNCREYLQRLYEFTRSIEFVENNDPDFVENYKHMAQTIVDVLSRFDGIKVNDYITVCNGITDSYLKAIVKFLARREGYNTIQNEIMSLKNLELEDKLAFAAIHMDDDNLNSALKVLLAELETEQRPLSALLITGLDDDAECHKVIHKYVDLTGDIQTAAILLVIGNCFRNSMVLQDISLVGIKASELLIKAINAKEEYGNPRRRSMHILRDYLDLMDNWGLWLPKTFLSSFLRIKPTFSADIEARARLMTIQAVVTCNFCGIPIYPTNSEKIEAQRGALLNMPLNSFPQRRGDKRMMACSRCRKPLPKCTICRRHFGSQAEMVSNRTENNELVPHTSIDHWFVWCCNCNHGGHLSHIRDWFYEYSICPASGCDCSCMDRDHGLRDDLYAKRHARPNTQSENPNEEKSSQKKDKSKILTILP